MDYGVNLYARIEASQKHLMKLSCLYTVPEKTTEIPIDVIHTTVQICPQTVIQIMMLKFLVLTPLKNLRTLTLTAIHLTPLMKVKLMVPKKKTFSAKEYACTAILALISRHCMTIRGC